MLQLQYHEQAQLQYPWSPTPLCRLELLMNPELDVEYHSFAL